MGWMLVPLAMALCAGPDDNSQPVAFYIQGMSCDMCIKEVSDSLEKLPTLSALDLKLKPPIARFRVSTDKVALQDVVEAIRGAGSKFDGKLIVMEDIGLSEATLDSLDKALSAVPGVKNTGAPNEKGRRLITLDLAKHTLLADVLKAGRSAGVELRTPNADQPR